MCHQENDFWRNVFEHKKCAYCCTVHFVESHYLQEFDFLVDSEPDGISCSCLIIKAVIKIKSVLFFFPLTSDKKGRSYKRSTIQIHAWKCIVCAEAVDL